jgi:hypothetical protein
VQDDNLTALTEDLEYELQNIEQQSGRQKQVVVQQLLELQKILPEDVPAQNCEDSSGPSSSSFLGASASSHFICEDLHHQAQGKLRDIYNSILDFQVPKESFVDEILMSEKSDTRHGNDQVYITL